MEISNPELLFVQTDMIDIVVDPNFYVKSICGYLHALIFFDFMFFTGD